MINSIISRQLAQVDGDLFPVLRLRRRIQLNREFLHVFHIRLGRRHLGFRHC
jgi:hypothetical protein